MDFERGIEAEELELEIAGFDVTCLVWDQDDVEAAVRNLVLFPQFETHFRNAFDLINTATSFWLEEGSYAPCAESITRNLYYLRDAIYDHASYAEAGSLPRVIRGLLRASHSAADSQLVATYALVLATQALETLANWLFDLELTTYGIDADLIEHLKHDSPRQYLALIEKERDRSSGNEIRAREEFATLLGEANQALLMASLYRQVEQMDVFKKGFNTSSLMHRILDDALSTKATRRGQEAGNGNRDPSSAKTLLIVFSLMVGFFAPTPGKSQRLRPVKLCRSLKAVTAWWERGHTKSRRIFILAAGVAQMALSRSNSFHSAKRTMPGRDAVQIQSQAAVRAVSLLGVFLSAWRNSASSGSSKCGCC